MTDRIISVQTDDLPAHVDHVVTFESGLRVKAVKRGRGLTARAYTAAPRIYGALDMLVPHLMEEEPHTDKAIPMNPETPEDIQAAKEWKAWKSATLREAKVRLRPVLAALADREDVAANELTFSVKAGCSCPCSPGFIYRGGGLGRLDYFFEEA